MREINEAQRKCIDRYFVNGFNREDAYAYAYPNAAAATRRQSMYILLQKENIKEYYARKYEEFKSMVDMDKHIMVDNLVSISHKYDDMLALACKDRLTANDEIRLERMASVLKGADAMKAKDMLCRIIGAYEPDKIEVTNKTWRVSFDDAEDAEISEE